MRRLSCVRDHRADQIDSVYRGGDAIKGSCFPLHNSGAQGLGAGPDQNGSLATGIARQGKSKLEASSRSDGDIGKKVEPGSGDISELRGVKLQRARIRSADLQWQVHLIPPSFSPLSHGSLRSVYCTTGSTVVECDSLKLKELIEFSGGQNGEKFPGVGNMCMGLEPHLDLFAGAAGRRFFRD